jgi:hypothetical protein
MRPTPPLLLAAAACFAAAAACFDPQFHDAACGPGGECPDGTSCVAGVCTAHVDPEAPTTPGCPEGQVTSLSGTVFAPNGTLPLPNVLVYVPAGPVEPFPAGAACARCGPPPSAIAAVSDAEGRFMVRHVPERAETLVIETGKWRRQIALPALARCADTPLASDLTRLPRTSAEGELPQLAVSTGNADALECTLRKVGIADSEFTAGSGPGRVHLYAETGATRFAAGPTFQPSSTLWASAASLARYDSVLLSCSGLATVRTSQPLYDYTALGGRVLAVHLHYRWLADGPPGFRDVAEFAEEPDLMPLEADVDMATPAGALLAAWLLATGASTTLGKLPIQAPQHTVAGVAPGVARAVYHDDVASGASTQQLAFTTPFVAPEPDRCGRFVFSDIHGSRDRSTSSVAFPDGCTTAGLSPEEKLFVYTLFELGRCVGGS